MRAIRRLAHQSSAQPPENQNPFSRLRSIKPPQIRRNSLSEKSSNGVPKKAYDFEAVYDADAVKSEYVLTKERLKIAQAELITARQTNKVDLRDIYGKERRINVEPETELMIDVNGIFQLADENPTTIEDAGSNLYKGFRYCPFLLGEVPENVPEPKYQIEEIKSKIKGWQEQWEKSKYPKFFDDFLKQNRKRVQKIDKVICFDLGWLELPRGSYLQHAQNAYIRHLAARHIANVIGGLQANDNSERAEENKTIQILAQDVYYTEYSSSLVKELGIKIADFKLAEGLDHVTENSFVIFLNVPDLVMQACIHLTGGKGPAGMLTVQRTEDHERQWAAKKLSERSRKDIGPWITSKELGYRNRCIRKTLEADPETPWFDVKEYSFAEEPHDAAEANRLRMERRVPVELLIR
ncbi:hypothetical protein BDV96DRAFT_664401 [Lophiotrema nucula]|uniref:SRR1-like domain-containing protein n=1 Tax=Lophiotrema nucula TaxID=690887 RepID=A0A6A5Z1J8_9PLEO|nr:hypothetical protein BDV96DRAFT_664401 [Lophiotrema nucula]